MKKVFVITILLPILSCALSAETKGAVILIDREISSGLFSYLKRAVEQAQKDGAEVIFFQMNTPGGRLDETFEIIEYIPTIPQTTVAYISAKALSAGALISLSCNQLVMKENTTIGDCAPLMMSQEGPKMLGEKFQSPLRANFRALAEKNGYPSKLSEAMVSEDMEIIEIVTRDTVQFLTAKEYEDVNSIDKKKILKKRTIVEKGKLLTMTSSEAQEYGFTRAVVKDSLGLYKEYGLSPAQVKHYVLTSSEKVLLFLNKLAPLIMMIGLICIYLEIKTPGFGLFGICAIACFVVLFLSKYIVGMADHVEIILFSLGCGLLFVEIFITPGFGILGGAGILLILLAMILSMQNFVIPDVPWKFNIFKKNILTVGIIFILSIPVFLFALFGGGGFLARTRLVHRQSETRTDGFRPSEDYSWLEGKSGITLSALRPAGFAEIEGKRLNVVSDCEFIKQGENIKVMEITGNRISVKKA
ncbi:MAG: NfeD family protein [bacterium]